MARWVMLGLMVTMGASSALGAPLFPEILDHDFSFLGGRASNEPTHIPYYSWNGANADTLTIPLGAPDDGIWENEVFAYTSPVIPKGPSYPIFEMDPDGAFGGDLYLDLRFTASDYGGGDVDGQEIDVSLTGTGNNDQGNDLEIWGQVTLPGGTYSGLLLAMEITEASLYGYALGQNYSVEAIGTITYSEIPGVGVGDPGAVTGAMFNPLIPLFLPSGYDPVQFDSFVDVEVSYSGEAGSQIPEPSTLAVAAFGGLAVFFRRRRS